MEIKRHKVFVSYYHNDDQEYKNQIIDWEYWDDEKFEYKSIFDDYSVGLGDIDDDLDDEQTRRIIRDQFLKEPTVFILLCGKNTKTRKHIDWEIHTAMYHSDVNPKMGIVVINLPTIIQARCASDDSEKPLISDDKNWVKLSTIEEYRENYPYMPERIIENLAAGKEISVVDWNRVKNNPKILMKLIDNAFKRRKNIVYNHSTPLRKKNSTEMTVNS